MEEFYDQAYILYLNNKLPCCLRPRPRPLASPVYIINSMPQQLHIRISSQQLEISSNSSNNNKESVSKVRVSMESAPAVVILPLNQHRDRRLRILDLQEREAEVNIQISFKPLKFISVNHNTFVIEPR